MAHGLKLRILAKGIEPEQQLNFLHQHGCDYYQGFLFHRPVPVIELEALLQRTQRPGKAARQQIVMKMAEEELTIAAATKNKKLWSLCSFSVIYFLKEAGMIEEYQER